MMSTYTRASSGKFCYLLLRAGQVFFAKHLFKLCLAVAGLLGFMVTKLIHVCLVGTLATLLSVRRDGCFNKAFKYGKKSNYFLLDHNQQKDRQ